VLPGSCSGDPNRLPAPDGDALLTWRATNDISRYNKICGSLRSLVHRLSLLPAKDPFRQQRETEMLNKLYDMGILGGSGSRSSIREPSAHIHLAHPLALGRVITLRVSC
jgi:hypothetical protein